MREDEGQLPSPTPSAAPSLSALLPRLATAEVRDRMLNNLVRCGIAVCLRSKMGNVGFRNIAAVAAAGVGDPEICGEWRRGRGGGGMPMSNSRLAFYRQPPQLANVTVGGTQFAISIKLGPVYINRSNCLKPCQGVVNAETL